MFKTKGFLKILIAIFLISAIQAKVIAAELSLPSISITPDKHLYYSVKRLVEKGTLLIKFSKTSKADYYRDLTLKRLAELKYVVENKLLSEVQQSTQRFSYQTGILSDYISTNKELLKREQDTQDFLVRSKDLLGGLRDKYTSNSSFWMLVQHSINSIDLNLEKLK